MPSEEVAARISALPGQLAIGNGPELFVSRPDGQLVQPLDGSESVVAAQPTWSRDGTILAWSSVSAERQVVLHQEFDDEGVAVADKTASNAEGNPVFYLQWNESDERLAYIRNAENGQEVEIGVVEPGSPIEAKGRGAPFFISWSPEPDRILGHVGERSIDLLDVSRSEETFTTITDVSGGFSAPAWIDNESALIATAGALAILDVDAGSVREVKKVSGPIRFVLSPDRRKVAYQVLPQGGGTSAISVQPSEADPTGLNILELDSGTEITVTSEPALAWEWSPDSQNLAWLGLRGANNRPIARWFFWSEQRGGQIGQGVDFAITRKYGQSYLPFFAQYGQSVTGWSPDSSAFAFAGSITGRSGIWIQLVGEAANPLRVAEGDFVTWGSGPSPSPEAGGASAA